MKALAISIFMVVCAGSSVLGGKTNMKDIKIPEMKEIKIKSEAPDFNIKEIEIENPKMKMKDIEIAIGDINVNIKKMKEMPEMAVPNLSDYDFGFNE